MAKLTFTQQSMQIGDFMGIGSNLEVEKAEEKYREHRFQGIIEEAAQFVVIDGLSRNEAFQKAKLLDEERDEAIRNEQYMELNEDGSLIRFTDESLEPATVPSDKKSQVAAVAKELFEQFENDL